MVYCALFKGINVGGKNSVKMAALKQILSDAGLSDIKTYIQSGNVVFESALAPIDLYALISEQFQSAFGFSPSIIIRDVDGMKSVVKDMPFSDKEIANAESADPDVTHLYVYFLDETIDEKGIDQLNHKYTERDSVRPGHGALYLLCFKSIRFSKLAAEISKTFPSATARNWNTVKKVYTLMIK